MMVPLILIAGSLVIAYFLIYYLLKRRISINSISFESVQDLQNNKDNPLIRAERFLRKIAFEEVNMARPEIFYTDEDLNSAFDFIVVRDRTSKTPLLSSRSYTDHSVIRKQLNGHDPGDYLTLSLLPDEHYVLLDRLSGNLKHSAFVKNRKRIFMSYYIHVLKSYPKNHIILMARSSPDERLLTKYIRLGFHVIGKQKHNQIAHWILLLPAKGRTRGLAQCAKQYVLFKLFA